MTTATPYRAVLTGATGGIGMALAFELAQHCEALLITGRNAQALLVLQEALLKNNQALKVAICSGDVNDPTWQEELVQKARELRINVLINNAGTNHFSGLAQLSSSQVSSILETNLLAPIEVSRILAPVLLKNPSSQIVQVGSIFGYIGYPGNSVYCASKFGLRGFAQAMAREYADTTLKVKYFAPRATSTPLNHGAVEQLNRELKVNSDTPEFVAKQLIALLGQNRFERRIGWPERLFVIMNLLFPSINDKAITSQLPIIKKYFLESK